MTAVLSGCSSPDPLAGLDVVSADPSDAPIVGLDQTWLERFAEGDALFETPYREATGLGPVYIRTSCASCHADDARGPGEVVKFAVVGVDGATPVDDQSALPFGHTARPYAAGGAVTPIDVPDLPDLLVTDRSPNAVFGRGYLEAIDEAEILRIADEQAASGDGLSGRPSLVPWTSAANTDARFHAYGPGDTAILGRFGHKARIATIDEFAADALQGDMSLTSPLRPDELPNPDGLVDDLLPGIDVDLDTVNLLADYVRLLALPDRVATEGSDVFDAVGCAGCHVPTLRTRDDWYLTPLAGIDAPVYTDLLLHDMGQDLSDGQDDGGASSTEWRTAPLIGLRFLRSFLHDGRASSVEDAVSAHAADGSESAASVDAFDALSPEDRAALLRFVQSL